MSRPLYPPILSPDCSIHFSGLYNLFNCAASSTIGREGLSSILCLDRCLVRWLMVSGRHYSLLLNCMVIHRRRVVVIELAGIVILYMIEGDVLIDEISRPISIKMSTEDRVPTFYTIILVPKFIDVVTS